VKKECEQLGLVLPTRHEHQWNDDVLELEEQEYRLATRLLCPSEHVYQTFLDRGYGPEKLARHRYGYDPKEFCPSHGSRPDGHSFTMLFVGGLSPVKGLHYALEAWLRSAAVRTGKFLIAGEATPDYVNILAPYLRHPSVQILGQRNDIPELMRQSDVLVLASITEGFGLVVAEAIGSGCVPLVSDRVTDVCRHMSNALVHPVGNSDVLSQHITMLYEDRDLLERLRAACLNMANEITWTAAGVRLFDIYREVISEKRLKPLQTATR
jgi:glycosyltransferase involved in cell wall biosynthesis